MKTFQQLFPFPLGSILADGFLKEQMQRGKQGICGRLHEIEPDMIANPFVRKTHVAAWGDGDQSGWGAEISGNYWFGYVTAVCFGSAKSGQGSERPPIPVPASLKP